MDRPGCRSHRTAPARRETCRSVLSWRRFLRSSTLLFDVRQPEGTRSLGDAAGRPAWLARRFGCSARLLGALFFGHSPFRSNRSISTCMKGDLSQWMRTRCGEHRHRRDYPARSVESRCFLTSDHSFHPARRDDVYSSVQTLKVIKRSLTFLRKYEFVSWILLEFKRDHARNGITISVRGSDTNVTLSGPIGSSRRSGLCVPEPQRS